MKINYKLLGLLASLSFMLGLAGGAGAQTLIHSTDWTTGSFGSATAGGAGTTTGAGDGWIDNAGNVATAGSANKLTVNAGNSPWTTGGVILRPTSENVRDEREVVTLPAPAVNLYSNQFVFRWQVGNTYYFAAFGGGTSNGAFTVTFYSSVSGTLK